MLSPTLPITTSFHLLSKKYLIISLFTDPAVYQERNFANYTDPDNLSETRFNSLKHQEAAADAAAQFLDSLSTKDMPPPTAEQGSSGRRKKTRVPQLSGLSRKRRAAEINERNLPEPGQSTLCGNQHNMAGCSGNDEPLKKKPRALDMIMSNVPVVDDFEYVVVKYKDYDTGFIIRQNGATVTVTTGMMNEMIRRNRNEK